MCFTFQNSAEVLSIISLLHDAKKKIDRWPSRAIDSGTTERNTIHLLSSFLNKLNSSCEYAGSQCVALSLGLTANYSMHKRFFLFSEQAITYCQEQSLLQLNQLQQDIIINDTSSCSSFSSGIYSNDVSEDSESSESEIQVQRLKLTGKQIITPALTEEEEFGSSIHNPEECISDTDSDVPEQTNQRIMGLLKRSAVHHGSIPVVKNINGQLCVVSQAEDYRYRGQDLLEYSLYEFVSATERRETKKNQEKNAKDLENSDSESDQSENDGNDCTANKESTLPANKMGRQPAKIVYFDPKHQLAQSHCSALLSKHRVIQFIKKVPPFPGPRPLPLTDVWKERARKFAAFCLVVFKPWTGQHGLPESTTWKCFCEYVNQLHKSPTIVDRTRYAFILNCSHNLKYSSSVNKILKGFRGSAATRWTEMETHYRPRGWLYGDETSKEKNLADKASRQEAELVMAELIHKICKISPSESKQQALLESTILSYSKAINIQNFEGSDNPRLSAISRDLPLLQDRLECFPPELVNQVHEHNLLSITDRRLQSQLEFRTSKKSRLNISRPCAEPDIDVPSLINWSPQQKTIIQAVQKFIENFGLWKRGRGAPPAPLHALIFGGPGLIFL